MDLGYDKFIELREAKLGLERQGDALRDTSQNSVARRGGFIRFAFFIGFFDGTSQRTKLKIE